MQQMRTFNHSVRGVPIVRKQPLPWFYVAP